MLNSEEVSNGSGTGSRVTPPADGLRVYWDVIVKRRWITTAFVLAVVGLTTVATLRQPRVYRASASVLIDLTLPQVLGQQNVQDVVDTGTNSYWYSKEFFLTQYKIITSRTVMQQAVDKLRLATDDAFLGIDKLPPDERAKRRQSIDPVAVMTGKVRVDPLRDSQIVSIGAEDTDPQRATLYANAVANAYIEHNLDQRLATTQAASDWLQQQIGVLKDKVESSELATFEFKKQNDTLSASLEDKQNIISQRLLALNEELTKQSARRAELTARVHQAEIAKKESAGDLADSVSDVAKSLFIQNLKIRLADASQQFAEVSGRYGDDHPKYIEAKKRVDSVRAVLQRETDRLLASTVSDLEETRETERNLRELIEVSKREAFELNKKDIDYKRLEREEENNRRVYDLVLKRLKETDLSSLLRTNNIHLLDQAQVPERPVRPNPRMNLILALTCGLMGGIGLAFLLEQLDTSIKGQEDIEQFLGISFLGVVPSIEAELTPARQQSPEPRILQDRDLYVQHHPKSILAECCKAIRTNLLFMTPDRPLKRILVFSSSPQEGKTTTVVNLAITMAQAGHRTLIVDSDMRRPRLHKTFGVPSATGLSTAILDETVLDEVVKSTTEPNLWVLPCGPIPPNPVELLHTAAFERLVDALSKKFDRIIFDSPPVLAVADAAVMARVMDGALLVLKAGQTPKQLAKRSVRVIQDIHCTILGAILNDFDVAKHSYGYGAYYYRGYYYGSDPSESAPPVGS